jgi:hypothetical protein
MKIGIGLSFYQDFDSLRRMLTSLQAYPIDLIIAIDGKYKGHAARRTLSNAECIDLFKSFQTPYTLDISPNTSQIEKRQRYFDLAIDLDCLIVMDSDEYFIQENTVWDLFVEDLVCKIKENSTTYK